MPVEKMNCSQLMVLLVSLDCFFPVKVRKEFESFVRSSLLLTGPHRGYLFNTAKIQIERKETQSQNE